jgi:hypothetical protein
VQCKILGNLQSVAVAILPEGNLDAELMPEIAPLVP